MKRAAPAAIILGALVLATAGLGRTQTGGAEPAVPEGETAPFQVAIVEPEYHDVLAGPVRVLARVDDPHGLVNRLELEVSGSKVAERKVQRAGPEPIESFTVEFEFDAGESARRRTLRVTAFDRSGRASVAEVTTRGVRINMAVRVDLIPLHVTVLDDRARATLALGRGDFEIYDQKKRQEIRHFDKGELPVTVALLLDTSSSMMGPKLVQAQSAVRSLLANLQPDEEVLVLPFSERISGLPDLTADKGALLLSLQSLKARGGTSLNDAIYMGLTLLQQADGKKALLVFSDGEEIHSCLDGEAVLWSAKNSPALIYLISLRGKGEDQRSYTSSWRNAELNQKQERALLDSVEISGGRSFRLTDIADLEQTFGAIAEELRSQYYLGYYPSDLRSTGRFRQIEVKVRGPYKVRTRSGYYDSASWLGRGRTQ